MPREGKAIKSESRLVWGLGWEMGMATNRHEEFFKHNSYYNAFNNNQLQRLIHTFASAHRPI